MSKKHVLGLSVAVLAAGALPLHGQLARQIPAHTKTLGPGSYGATVAQLGDWNGDAVSEYAVGSPLDTSAGTLAGRVRVFDGATGSVLRTVNGTSYPSTCSGFAGGDLLGSDVTDIADLDGDGKRELLATRPQAHFLTSCWQIGHGGFTIIHSNPATPNFNWTSPTSVGLGQAAAGLDPQGSLPTFVVSTLFGVEVWQQATPGASPTRTSTYTTFGLRGSELCSAGSPGGVPAFAADANGDQVFVRNVAGGFVLNISGPPSSGFGRALAQLKQPGLLDALVIGGPLGNSGDGLVWVVDSTGLVVTQMAGVPTSNEGFGFDVATGGDVDGDGDQDFVASAVSAAGSNPGFVVIADRNGNKTKRPITASGSSTGFGGAVEILPDLQGDGSAEVLVGAAAQNTSWVYFGGPDATVTSVGLSCSQGTSFLPVLGFNADPIIGTSPSFGQTGASPGCFSGLLAGTIDPVGTVVPPGSCLVHLQLTPPPVTSFSAITDAGGGWVAPPTFMPTLMGFEAGFQSVTISAAPGNPLEFSNAINIKLGW